MGEVVLFSISRSAKAGQRVLFRKSFLPCLEQTEAEVGPGERQLTNGVGVHIVLQVAIRQQSLLPNASRSCAVVRLRRMEFLFRASSKRSIEEAASEAALPGDEAPLPNIGAAFPPFGSKSVEVWPNLPATNTRHFRYDNDGGPFR